MKCFFKSNIAYLALFLILCLANSIIIDTNNVNVKDNTIAKPETLKLMKIFEIKKIAENELNILKKTKERLENSMKRLDVFQNKEDDKNNILNFFKENISIIISLSAVLIGFIFAGIFMIVAFLLSQ